MYAITGMIEADPLAALWRVGVFRGVGVAYGEIVARRGLDGVL